jgi:DNA polymerase alpha-associated DNA helicase A
MTTLSPTDIPSFASHQIGLLDAELTAETTENAVLLSSASPVQLARAGLAILNLSVSSQRTGLGGKSVVELELDSAVAGTNGGDLPEHGIRTGDIVAVSEQPAGSAKKKVKDEMKGRGAEGVVVRVGGKSIKIALGEGKGEEEGLGSGKLWVWVYVSG